MWKEQKWKGDMWIQIKFKEELRKNYGRVR